MHVTRRASGLETRPDIARGIITRAFLASRCCCSEFYCKACAFSLPDDIDESCTALSPFRWILLPKCRILQHNSGHAAFTASASEGQEIDCNCQVNSAAGYGP